MKDIVLAALAAAVCMQALWIVRVLKQMRFWSRQLRENEPDSNQRLRTELRGRTFRQFCLAVNERLEACQKAQVEAERADRELKYTISSISHDIRTPLTGACGYLEILAAQEEQEREEQNTEEQNRRSRIEIQEVQKETECRGRLAYIEIIRRRLNELERLLDELFLYTKLSQEEYTLECGTVHLYPVLCEVLAGSYLQIQESGLAPEISFEQETVSVQADEEAVGRIFRNLLQNALRYGCGELNITQRGNTVFFQNRVREPQKLDSERLFERFYRADTARRKNGSGLGLSIVRQLMEKMGGSVKAELKDGILTIEVCFPE